MIHHSKKKPGKYKIISKQKERFHATQSGNWYVGGDQESSTMKYFPKIKEIKMPYERLQVSDINFYKNRKNNRNYYMTSHALRTSTNFKNKSKAKNFNNSKKQNDPDSKVFHSVIDNKKNTFQSKKGNTRPHNQNQREIMASLKQSEFKQRPSSSRMEKRIFLSAKGNRPYLQGDLGQTYEITSKMVKFTNDNVKGIYPKRVEKERIPINTMYGGIEPKKETSHVGTFKKKKKTEKKYTKGDDMAGVEIIGKAFKQRVGSADPRKRKALHKKERNGLPLKSNTPSIKITKHKTLNQKQVTVTTTNDGIVPFQTSLSPEFLNLFAK